MRFVRTIFKSRTCFVFGTLIVPEGKGREKETKMGNLSAPYFPPILPLFFLWVYVFPTPSASPYHQKVRFTEMVLHLEVGSTFPP